YHYNAFIAERTNDLIATYQQDDDPFFMWASFPDPHPPYLASAPWDEMYDPDALSYPEGVQGEHTKNPEHFQLTQEENPDMSSYEETGYMMNGMHSHVLDKETIKKNKALYYGMVSFTDNISEKYWIIWKNSASWKIR